MYTVNYLDLEPMEFLDFGSISGNEHHEESFNQNYDVNITQASPTKLSCLLDNIFEQLPDDAKKYYLWR